MTDELKKSKKATKLMIDIIGEQLVDYTINKPSGKPISFVMCREGVVEVRKTPVGQFARLHTKIEDAEGNLIFKFMKVDPKQLKSAADIPLFRMDLPRIPLKFLQEIVHFFKAVHKKQETEAAALIRWNLEKKEYYVEIPGGPKDKFQDLSGGGVQYKPDLKDHNPIVMDLHSHHTMSPFFSTTDDGDEKGTQLYAVIGHIDHSQEAINIRVRMSGTDLVTNVPVEKIFEKNVTFEPSWMDNIRRPPIEATKTYEPYVHGARNWADDEAPWKRGSKRRRRRSLHRYPPGFPPNWEERLDEHTRETSRAPTLQEIMEMENLTDNETSDTPPVTMPEDAEIVTAFEDIWQLVEKEFYDRPEIFGNQEAIKELRTFLSEQMSTISATEILRYSNNHKAPEAI